MKFPDDIWAYAHAKVTAEALLQSPLQQSGDLWARTCAKVGTETLYLGPQQ